MPPRKYHLEFSGGELQYTEKYPANLGQMLSDQTGKDIITLEGDDEMGTTKGPYYRVALTEEMGGLFTRIGYGRSKFEDINYKFHVDGEGDYEQVLSTEFEGWDIFLGINWKYLKPGIAYKGGDIKGTTVATGVISGTFQNKTEYSMLGLGLILDIPISDNVILFAEGFYAAKSEGVLLTKNDGPFSTTSYFGTQTYIFQSASVGLRFGGWEVK